MCQDVTAKLVRFDNLTKVQKKMYYANVGIENHERALILKNGAVEIWYHIANSSPLPSHI